MNIFFFFYSIQLIYYILTVFRDSILKILSGAQPDNFEEISQTLDAAGNTVDFRKYGETLFEILLTGGVLGI